MADASRSGVGAAGGGGGPPQFFTPSLLNVFGVDPKHFDKWLRIWEDKRPYSEVEPSADNPKKLNCVSTDFLLRTGRTKRWRTRSVVLRGHFLYYFRQPKHNSPCRGVVLVKGCAITTFQSFEGKTNVILLGPNTTRRPGWRPDISRRFYFSLSSPAELNKWHKMLKLAAHTERTYNKYMVKTITVPTPSGPAAAGASSPLSSSPPAVVVTAATTKDRPDSAERAAGTSSSGNSPKQGARNESLPRADASCELTEGATTAAPLQTHNNAEDAGKTKRKGSKKGSGERVTKSDDEPTTHQEGGEDAVGSNGSANGGTKKEKKEKKAKRKKSSSGKWGKDKGSASSSSPSPSSSPTTQHN